VDCQTFAEFMREVCAGQVRCQPDDGLRSAEHGVEFPDFTVRQFTKVGRTNWRVLDRAIPRDEENTKWAQDLIAKASELETADLMDLCWRKTIWRPGSIRGLSSFALVNKSQLKRFESFFTKKRADASALCTDNWAKMLDQVLKETATAWEAESYDQDARPRTATRYRNHLTLRDTNRPRWSDGSMKISGISLRNCAGPCGPWWTGRQEAYSAEIRGYMAAGTTRLLQRR